MVRQETQMMFDGQAKPHFVAGGVESGVNFGHALLQPQGPQAVVLPEQQVGIFVENGLHGPGIRAGQREDNQIFIAAAFKKARQTDGFALVKGQKGLHGGEVGKAQHENRRRSDGLGPGKLGIGIPELFQSRR